MTVNVNTVNSTVNAIISNVNRPWGLVPVPKFMLSKQKHNHPSEVLSTCLYAQSNSVPLGLFTAIPSEAPSSSLV